jgi:phage terminase small subunit
MTTIPRAPGHLSPSVKRWFRQVTGAYEMDESTIRILVAACELWDRAYEAREVLDVEGLTFKDKFMNPRKHPCVDIEINCKLAFSKLLKSIGLPSEDPPVPVPGSRSHKKGNPS